MESNNPLQCVKISSIKLADLKSHGTKNSRFHIHINDGRNSQQTEKKRLEGNSVSWNGPFRIYTNGTDQSMVNFRVIKTRRIGIFSTIGTCDYKIADLLKTQADTGLCNLDIDIRYRMTLINIEKVPNPISEVIDETSNMLPKEGADTWSLFLSHFQTFMTVMDSIAPVNNYVKLAWSVLSLIPQTCLQIRDRNDNIRKLCEKLKGTYEYIMVSERISFLKTKQSAVLETLAKQTSECAFCIQDYTKSNEAKKLWRSNIMDSKIKEFNEKFDHIISVINNFVTLETSIVTLRTAEISGESNDLLLLKEIPYASHAGFVSEKRCHPGTRQSIINELFRWVGSDAPQRILLLTGQSGMGKSAVAHTIADIFQGQNRLGAIFCFNRSYKDDCGQFFSTISRKLADVDPVWRRSLVEIARNIDISTSTDPVRQFNELIVKPAQKTTPIGGPVVIVIDALNECGGRAERQIILDLLFGRCEEFPDNYRIIVTSCPEQDIELLSKNSAVLCKRMTDISAGETVSDIEKYISFRLKSISHILHGIDENWSSVLTKRSERLFQWAETACRFIDPYTRHPPSIEKRWKACVADSGLTLNDLYERIIINLSGQSELEDPDFMRDFKLIVGALMTSQRPLSMQALENIFQDVIHHPKTILSPFGSLFLGIGNDTEPIRPFHSSLFDFFQHNGLAKPNSYHIDTSNQDSFSLGCLKLMNRTLRFNICDLKTSHKKNRDIFKLEAPIGEAIPSHMKNRDIIKLEDRIDKAIPSHLLYACRFWAFHLKHSNTEENTDTRNDILEEVRTLVHVKLLYLLEVLSLLRRVDEGIKSMKILAAWCKDVDSELAEKAEDARRFGYDFRDVMTFSTPHLYLSALPFTSSDSFVFKQYFPLYPQLLTINVDKSLTPAPKIKHLKKHDNAKPFKVAFSPYGPYIAAGFDNGELWIWNYETGEMAYSYKPKKAFALRDVIFSTDRVSVYSSAKNGVIRESTFMKDHTSHYPYQGVFQGQSRFCTISSDGRFIASNSKNKLRLYDIHTKADKTLETQRKTVQNNGSHDRMSLSAVQNDSRSIFSPSGNLLAFVHADHTKNNTTVCIWDIHAEECIATWVQAPKRRIQIKALNDEWIAFATVSSLKICNVPTKSEVHKIDDINVLIEGVTFFPNNEHFLYYSGKTYNIRSIQTGELVFTNSIENCIKTIAISSDSEFIALGTTDGTVCIQRWNDNSDNTLGRDGSAGTLQIWLLNRYLVQELRSGTDRYLQISDITTTNNIVLKQKIDDNSHISVPILSQHACVGYTLNYRLVIWDEKGEFILEESEHDIFALAFSPIGDDIISANSNGNIKLWNVSTRQLVHEMHVVPKWIQAPAFCTRGLKFLIASYANQWVSIEVREFPSQIISEISFQSPSPLLKAVFSANETRIACIAQSGITILNASGGEHEHFFDFKNKNLNKKSRPQFSPDNKYVAWIVFNHEIRIHQLKLWDMDDEVMILGSWSSYNVHTFHFSNDSTSLIISHSSQITRRYITIWEIETGKEISKTISHFITWGRSPLMALNGRHFVLAHNAFGTIWNLDMHNILSPLYESSLEADQNAPPFDRPEGETGGEDLKYAKMAWKKALFTDFAQISPNGWIMGSKGEYLFWVPPERRRGLWRPCVTHIAAEHITKVNFDKFVHGTRWTECNKS